MTAIPKEQRCTYSDYITWNEDVRCELIDGYVHMMSPAPTWQHQGIVRELLTQLHNFLKGKPCKVYPAPFDVRLDPGGADDTVVQPDIVVLCDKSKLAKTGCDGPPDFVIEILSSSTAHMDRVVKFNKYLQHGVKEYWIVDPTHKIVSTHILENGKYVAAPYGGDDVVPVHVLSGCEINMREVFDYS